MSIAGLSTGTQAFPPWALREHGACQTLFGKTNTYVLLCKSLCHDWWLYITFTAHAGREAEAAPPPPRLSKPLPSKLSIDDAEVREKVRRPLPTPRPACWGGRPGCCAARHAPLERKTLPNAAEVFGRF